MLPISARTRRIIAAAASGVAVLALSACNGNTRPATQVTANSATLNATVSCLGLDDAHPCTMRMKHWRDWQNVPGFGVVEAAAPQFTNEATATGAFSIDVSPQVSGLTPGMLYRYQVCGRGDTGVTEFFCRGSRVTEGTDGLFAASAITAPYEGQSMPIPPEDAGSFSTAAPGMGASVDLGRLTSQVETDQGIALNRDGGLSAHFKQGKSFWVFGDTFRYDAQHNLLPGSILGTTAAEGTYTAGNPAVTLAEHNTGRAGNDYYSQYRFSRFLSSAPAITGCSQAVRWPTGLATVPSTVQSDRKVLVTFGDFCLTSSMREVRTGLAEYDVNTKTFNTTGGAAEQVLFTGTLTAPVPQARSLGQPVFDGDHIYFHSVKQSALLPGPAISQGTVYAARVLKTQWRNPAAYQWRNAAGGWTSSSADASGVLPADPAGIPTPVHGNVGEVEVKHFPDLAGNKFVMIRQQLLSRQFTVYTAATPAGPWTVRTRGALPEACKPYDDPNDPNDVYLPCYAVWPHPELSTANRLVYTWWSHLDLGGHGHLRVGTLDW